MGLNWPFLFCQALVESIILGSGFAEASLIQEKRVVPDVGAEPAAVVYVDGVAVLGDDLLRVRAGIRAVEGNMEARGL
eukprot:11191197-Lingulodinium_polyedra.AAC.1